MPARLSQFLKSSLRALPGVAAGIVWATTAHAQANWTLRNQDANAGADYLWSATDGAAGIVAVGDGGHIFSSADAKAWVSRTSGTTAILTAVASGGGQYVAVGDSGAIVTSPDAITWTASNSGTTSRLDAIGYAQNRFVAVGENGVALVSLDGGATWQSEATGVGGAWLHGLAFGGGRWVAVGQGGMIITSADGMTWTKQNGATTQDMESVALAETYSAAYTASTTTYAQFLMVGAGGVAQVGSLTVYNSLSDGSTAATFNAVLAPHPDTAARLRGLVAGNRVYVATGDDGLVYTSPSEYGPWSKVTLATGKNLLAGAFAQGALLLVGESATVYQSEAIVTSRLGNISTGGLAGGGANVMVAGTVISGTAAKKMLVRAAGPALAGFGVDGTLPDPVLTIYDNVGHKVASNSGWSSDPSAVATLATAASAVGAFPLPGNSRDCAITATLSPGPYTFVLSSTSGDTGKALIEAYDADPFGSTSTRAINISTRAMIGTSDTILNAGLVVQGPSSRTLLIRGVGPTLGSFGVTGVLTDLTVKVVAISSTPGNGGVLAANDNWSDGTLSNGRMVSADEVQTAAAAVGAFPLAAGSKDAALVITLPPGSYSIQVAGVNGATGVALVEAYDISGN